VRIAFFSYTNFINQEFLQFHDHSNQIFFLPRKKQPERRERFFNAIRSAKNDPSIDLVVLSIHWGIDYVGWIFRSQKKLAHEMLEAGADIILGHHSHVLQPMEKYLTADGRETFIIYSLGNFTTDMPGIRAQTSIILYLGITKNETGTFLSGLEYLPVARQKITDSGNGKPLIQIVAIDRFHPNLFNRHRKRAIRLFGSGNLKDPDAEFSYLIS
jgi:poly-gamma-glutamate synthesis protein (capsule biosynthesis protein)